MSSPFITSVRNQMQARHYSKRTEDTYIYWILQYIRYNNKKHPKEMGENEIAAFLEYLAVERKVSPATQKTALNAVMYMYNKVLEKLIKLTSFVYAKPSKKLPVVLSRSEIKAIFSHLQGEYLTCANLMYGSGLRLMEAVRLRVKDINLNNLSIFVMEGKGRKQRITTLSEQCIPSLERQLAIVKSYWEEDLQSKKWDGVYLPYALARKHPKAPFELGLLERGADIRTVQEQLGHSDVRTTEIAAPSFLLIAALVSPTHRIRM